MTKFWRIFLSVLLIGSFLIIAIPAGAGPGACGTVNLAKNKPVTALSNTMRGAPANIVDGNIDTEWYSMSYDGRYYQSFTLDLGAVYSIGRIDLLLTQVYGYNISTSTDGSSWTPRLSNDWPGTAIDVWAGPASHNVNGAFSARYIKYYGWCNYYMYVGLLEIEVYEWLSSPPPPPVGSYGQTNIALNKPVTNIWDSLVPSNPPSYAVDGNPATTWLAGWAVRDGIGLYQSGGAIRIDLGQEYQIGKIVVNPALIHSYHIKMKATPAGAPLYWVFKSYPAFYGTNTTFSEPYTFNIDGATSARYLDLEPRVSASTYYIQPGIAEIQVYEWVTTPPADTTPPVITPTVSGTMGNNDWYTSNVTVSWTVTDPESAITSIIGGDTTVISANTPGTTLTCSATSAGGTASASVTIKRDATAPSITINVPAEGAQYVVGETVVADWNAADALSGVANATASPIDTSTTGSRIFTAVATDFAGNVTSLTRNYSVIPPPDTTPPVITPTVSGTMGNNGWYTSNVTVSWTVTDPESAITSIIGGDTTVISADTPGTTLTCSATSSGGTASASVTIKRDATSPSITINTPAEGAQYQVGEVAVADWYASDALSGVANATASPMDTSTAGTKTFTVVATDIAGNTTTVTRNYSVISETTPISQIKSLIDYIASLNLQQGIKNSLTAKLNAAMTSLQQGQIATAVNQLNALVNEVSAQTGKKIPGTEAQNLINTIQVIITAINAG